MTSPSEDLVPQDWGVAWFGDGAKGGVCQRCQRGAPVYQGYNGGQYMGVDMCSSCIPLALREDRLYRDQAQARYRATRPPLSEIEIARMRRRHERDLELDILCSKLETRFPTGTVVSFEEDGVMRCGVSAGYSVPSNRMRVLVDGRTVHVRWQELLEGDQRPARRKGWRWWGWN